MTTLQKAKKWCKDHDIVIKGHKSKIFLYKKGIKKVPKCEVCNKNDANWNSELNRFTSYCSRACKDSPKGVEVRKKNMLNKYGVENPMHLKEIVEKAQKTTLERYGTTSYAKTDEYKQKVKSTNLKKYGTEWNIVSDDVKSKSKETLIKKYGVDNYAKTDEFRDKTKATNKIKYGTEHYTKSDDYKKKVIKSSQDKYGVNHFMESKEHQNYLKECNQKKFGKDYYAQTDQWKEMMKRKANERGYETLIDFYNESNTKRMMSELLNSGYEHVNTNSSTYIFKCLHCKCDSDDNIFEIPKHILKSRKSKGIEICLKRLPINPNTSQVELSVMDFVNSLGVDVVSSHRGCKEIGEIDIFLPDHNIGFEINGLYWHNENYKDKFYHLNKTLAAKDNNIRLYHIWEDQIYERFEVVKSVIRNKIGLNTNKIYGRKTDVVELKTPEAKKFLEKNHLQGYSNSKVKLGLYKDGCLYSVMTFGKPRVGIGSKSHQWELIRFASKKNYTVIGGASKLFKYFLTKYTPTDVVSYQDLAIMDGRLYEQLGFEHSHDSKPNYYYVDNVTRIHRYNFTKHKLVKEGYDPSMTEHEIMLSRGIYRIYDCGTRVWVWYN